MVILYFHFNKNTEETKKIKKNRRQMPLYTQTDENKLTH